MYTELPLKGIQAAMVALRLYAKIITRNNRGLPEEAASDCLYKKVGSIRQIQEKKGKTYVPNGCH